MAEGLGIGITLAGAMHVLTIAFLLTPHRAQMIVGLVLRSAVATAIFVLLGLAAPDAMLYDQVALETAESWSKGEAPPSLAAGKEGFSLLLAGAYLLAGHAPVIGVIINVVAGTLTIPIVGATAERLGLPAARTAWLVALFPPLWYWGGMLLREALIWLTLAIIGYGLAGVVTQRSGKNLVAVVVGLAGLWSLRATAAILIFIGIMIAVLVMPRRQRAKLVASAALLTILTAPLLGPRVAVLLERYGLEGIDASRQVLSQADSGFATVSLEDPVQALLNLPIGVLRSLLGPFPWEWPSLNPLLLFDALVWLLFVVLTLAGIRRAWRRELIAPAMTAVVLLMALAITSGNYGTMQRLRWQSMVLAAPIAAVALVPTRTRRDDALEEPPVVENATEAAASRVDRGVQPRAEQPD